VSATNFPAPYVAEAQMALFRVPAPSANIATDQVAPLSELFHTRLKPPFIPTKKTSEPVEPPKTVAAAPTLDRRSFAHDPDVKATSLPASWNVKVFASGIDVTVQVQPLAPSAVLGSPDAKENTSPIDNK
jgi:hypothetical protein